MFWIGLIFTLIGTVIMGLGTNKFRNNSIESMNDLIDKNDKHLRQIKKLKKENDSLHKQLKIEVIKSRFDLPEQGTGLLNIEIIAKDGQFNESIKKIFGDKVMKRIKSSRKQFGTGNVKNDGIVNISESIESDEPLLFYDIKFSSYFKKHGKPIGSFLAISPIENRFKKIKYNYKLNREGEFLHIYYMFNQRVNASKHLTGTDLCGSICKNTITYLIEEPAIVKELDKISVKNFRMIVSNQSFILETKDQPIISNEHKYIVESEYTVQADCWNK